VTNIPHKRRARIFRGTGVTNLSLETTTGTYYLLAKINGISHRVSLLTKDPATAKARFETRMAELRRSSAKGNGLKIDARFDEAAMWRQFTMKTMPALVKQLTRLNRNLERANKG
jgi:hypothetical protein